MKINIVSVLLLMSSFLFSQTDNKERKIQIGIQYNFLSNKNTTYSGIVGLNTRYKIVALPEFGFNIGLSGYMLKSKIHNFSNIVIVNPNITTEYNIERINLKPYIGIGYNFYTSKFTTDPIPLITESQERKFNYSGFNINPGIQYNFNERLFVDLNYNFISTKSTDTYKMENKFNLIGIGLGIIF